MELSLPPKLVEKLVSVPVILVCKILKLNIKKCNQSLLTKSKKWPNMGQNSRLVFWVVFKIPGENWIGFQANSQLGLEILLILNFLLQKKPKPVGF
jgi:uncharacterized membrane protein